MKMPRRFLALVIILALSGRGEAKADLVYFSSTENGTTGPHAFETLDTSTGAVNVISSTTPVLLGLQNVNGQVYGEGYNSGELYQVNTTTGATNGLGVISGDYTGTGGTIYVEGPTGLTYEFNSDTGGISTLAPPSTTATATQLTTFSYNSLYAVRDDGQIYGIHNAGGGLQTLDLLNPATGVLTTGPTLSTNLGGYSSLFIDGTSLDLLSQTGLYTIDTTTGIVTQDFALSLSQVFAASTLTPTTVPEPSSLLLCLIGGATLVLATRRRRRRRGLASPPRPLVG